MKKALLLFFLMALMLVPGITSPAEQGEELPMFLFDPCISPDGSLIAFEYQGDIWTVPVEGGDARRLTLHMAMERRPIFTPDGKWLVYSANYFGDLNLFVMPVEGGTSRRLTYGPAADIASSISADGKFVYFYGANDGNYEIYRVPFDGGTPVKIAGALMDSVLAPCPSPNGNKVAFSFRYDHSGLSRQGWTTPYSSEIYIADNTAPATNIVRCTNNLHQEFLPIWNQDGNRLFFLSDRDGVYNLYSMSATEHADVRQISKFKDTGIRWYSVSANGKIAIYRNRRIHILDEATGEARLVEINIFNPAKMNLNEMKMGKPNITDIAPSPDMKKVVFIHNHDIYIMASDGGFAKPLTATAQRESDLSWSLDSKYIIFNRIVDGGMNIVRLEVATGTEQVLTHGNDSKFFPSYSPDGKSIVYHHDYYEIAMMDADGQNPRTFVSGDFPISVLRDSTNFMFSDDGKWIFYTPTNDALFADAYALKMGSADNKPVKMTTLGGYNTLGSFTKDYSKFVFNSYQIGPGGSYNLAAYVIDLTVDTKPKRHPKQDLEDLLNPPAKTDKPDNEKPDDEKKDEDKTEPKEPEAKQKPEDNINFDNLYRKTRRAFATIPSRHYIADMISPTSALVAIETSPLLFNFFVASLDPESKAPPKQLTNLRGRLTAYSIDKAKANLYYVENGELYKLTLSSGSAKKISPSVLQTKFSAPEMRKAVLDELFWVLDAGFYDPKHHGVDMATLRARYEPLIAKCETDREFYSIVNDVFGDLNASHLSFGGGSILPDVGRIVEKKPHLGFLYDNSLIEKGQLRIAGILNGTPAALPDSGLKEGDFVLEINGTKISSGVAVYSIIRNCLGDDLELTIADDAEGANSRTIYLPTIDLRTFFRARINDWEERNRDYVEKQTDGKFGYIWVRDMLGVEFERFVTQINRYMSSYDGVIIDFRYNGGGFTAAKIAEMLDDKPWLFSKLRGSEWVPEDYHRRGMSFQKATCGLFNYACFSNAEMMCSAYRLKKLGPSVGMPTAGGVIGTSLVKLLDDSSMGLPSNRVEDLTGRNLELSPTEPEFIVDMDIIDIMAGRDPQIDRGIEELKKEVPRRKAELQPKVE